MATKITVFFGQDTYGWTETYYLRSTGVSDALNSIDPKTAPVGSLGELLLIRLNCLSISARMIRVRASDTQASQTEDALDLENLPFDGRYTAVAKAAEEPISLLVRMSGVSTNAKVVHRNLYMAGLPEDIITGGVRYTPSAAWIGAIEAFKAVLKSSNWTWPTRPDRKDAIPIGQFLISLDGRTVSVSPPLLGNVVPASGRVIIRGMSFPRGWNGTHTAHNIIDPVNPAVVDMYIGPGKHARPSLPAWIPFYGGTIQLVSEILVNINRVNDERLVSHKRGRPFGEPVGRRS